MMLKLLVLLGAVFALCQARYYKPKPKPIVESSVCPYGWKTYKTNCYYFSTVKHNRNIAARICKEKGASLVNVVNYQENQFLADVAKTLGNRRSYWISPICRTSKKYYYKCVWKEISKFNAWYKKPAPKGPGCAALSGSCKWKLWKSENCNKKNYFICRKAATLTKAPALIIIDKNFAEVREGGSSSSSSEEGGKKGRKYKKKNGSKSSSSSSSEEGSKKGRKYRKKNGSKSSSSSSSEEGGKKGRKYKKKNGSKRSSSSSSEEGGKKGRKYKKKNGSKSSSSSSSEEGGKKGGSKRKY